MAKWEEIRDDLFEAIIQVQPTINKEQQADIVKIMQARGHDTSWNAIRYVYYACQSWDDNLAANSNHPEQVLGVAAWLGLVPTTFSILLRALPPTSHLPHFSSPQLLYKLRPFPTPSLHCHSKQHTNQQPKHHKQYKHTVTMGRILQNWDAETHEDILVALIEHMRPVGSDWAAVTAALRSKGYTFTEGALVYVQMDFFRLELFLRVWFWPSCLSLALFPFPSPFPTISFFHQTTNAFSPAALCNHHQSLSTPQPTPKPLSLPLLLCLLGHQNVEAADYLGP
jgi:hypothetical protein